jgi:hypothetical protein
LQASIQSLRRRQHQLEGMREGAPPEYGKKMALAPGGFAMNNRFIVAAAFLLLLFQLNHGDAASPGPYDGEWTGQATSAGERCKRAVVNFTIEGRVVLGQARFDGDTPSINGTVDESGAVGATIGFQFLRGQFSGDEFEGTFKFSDCQWDTVLRRAGAADRNHASSRPRGR